MLRFAQASRAPLSSWQSQRLVKLKAWCKALPTSRKIQDAYLISCGVLTVLWNLRNLLCRLQKPKLSWQQLWRMHQKSWEAFFKGIYSSSSSYERWFRRERAVFSHANLHCLVDCPLTSKHTESTFQKARLHNMPNTIDNQFTGKKVCR